MSTQNPVNEAIDLAGAKPIAAACGVTYQAVLKWGKLGRLPRTEWTGETAYAVEIESLTDGAVSRDRLLDFSAA